MHLRCPHCHNPIEVVDETPLSDLTCPSCGSQFSLISSETTCTHQTGTRVLGHFELLEEIGIGHFGSVWKARDSELDRTVAIKIPRQGQLDAVQSEIFLRDARAAAQLKHPNIVGVHEVGRDGDTLFIVSDYIQGANLKEWLSGQQLTAREAADLVARIAEALHHAHEAGVVHRDLKPGNIMMDVAGEPHIIDFGLAKRDAGEITVTVQGQVLGTPAYMPPEQARGEGHTADRRSDVYSLGVILFELLTGELPFRGEQRMLIVQILRDEPPSPRKLNGRVPRDLETVTLKCLEKDPAKRYPTAQALTDELRRWLRGEPIQARPVGRITRGWRWCKRNPHLAIVGDVALLLVIAIVAGSIFATIRINAARNDAVAEKNRADVKADEALTHAERAQKEQETARRLFYAADMNLAQRAWEDSRLENVNELTSRYEPRPGEHDLRGWEWYYQQRLLQSDLRTLKGHTNIVVSVTISPDGRSLTSASMDQTIKLWNADTGDSLRTVKFQSGHTARVALSPDGRRFASADTDQIIKVWDAETGAELRTIDSHFAILFNLAFSPDGRRLASCGGGASNQIGLWDTESGTELRSLRDPTIPYSVAFSQNGQRLASGGYAGTVGLWDSDSGEQKWQVLKGHSPRARVTSVAFSPDGRRLASGSDDSTIKVWDAETGNELHMLKGHSDSVVSLAFSPNGRRLASAGNRAIKVWDADTGDNLRTYTGHSDGVTSVAFSADGRWLASASVDQTVKMWDAQATTTLRRLGSSNNRIRALTVSPDGRHLASACMNTVAWNGGADGEELIEGSSMPDGGLMASASENKTITVWNTETGMEERTVRGHPRDITNVAYSPDGRRLASASEDGSIKLWDAKTGIAERTLKGHASAVTLLAFSPDGRTLASASDDTTIKVWDAVVGAELRTLKGHNGAVRSVAFSPDGRTLASASDDTTIKVWDAVVGAELRTLKGHNGAVRSVAFSPDGRTLASASDDTTIKVWDAVVGAELRTLKGHNGAVRSVVFTAGGWCLVSEGADGTIGVWEAALLTSDEKMASFRTKELFEDLVFSDEVVEVIRKTQNWSQSMRDAGAAYARSLASDSASVYTATWNEVTKPIDSHDAKLVRLRKNAEALRRRRPDDPESGRLLALCCYRQGQSAEALRILDVDAADDPHTLAIRLLAYTDQRNYDKARNASDLLRTVLIAAPKPTDRELVDLLEVIRNASVRLGKTSYWKHDWLVAATEFRLAVILNFSDPSLYEQLGEAQGASRRWDEAQQAFAKAVELTDHKWDLMFRWALMRLAADDDAGFRATCADLLKRHGTTNDAYQAYWIALTCVVGEKAVDDWPRVLVLARKAADADSKNPIPQVVLGAALYRAGRTDEAITILTTALPRHALATLAAPKQLDQIRTSRLLGEVILTLAYRDKNDAANLAPQLDKLRKLVTLMESTPPQYSQGISPWAIPFGIEMAKRSLATFPFPTTADAK